MIFKCIRLSFFLALLNLFSISVVVYMGFIINNWYLDFYSALSCNRQQLPYMILLFITYNIISHISFSLKEFTQYTIGMNWRTNLIAKAIKKIKPHLIEISNPDQRLCEDSNEFISNFLRLASDIILNCTSMIVFAVSLVRITSISIAYKLMFGMVLYTIFCNQIISYYVKRYILRLGSKNEENEADLRSRVYELHQIKYGFSIGIKNNIIALIRILLAYQKKYLNSKIIVSFMQKFFDENLGMILPYLLIYLFNEKTWNIGLIMQIVHCLTVMKFRMMFFSENIHDIYVAKIGYLRLKKYTDHIEESNVGLRKAQSTNLAIYFPKIAVGNKTLLNNLELHLNKSKSMCLYGGSGIGKTTLLRYINDSMKNVEGQLNYSGKMICLCIENLKHYLLSRNKSVQHLSQGELQKVCVNCLIEEKPDWIIWDEFCLGLSQQSMKEEFVKLNTNLENAGLLLLTQDKLDFCDQIVCLERFAL